MKNVFFHALAWMICLISCKQDLQPPVGVTNEVRIILQPLTDITSSHAGFDATVLSDGGDLITQRGVVVSTNSEPTIQDLKKEMGGGMGRFTDTIGGLKSNTTYYIGPYAINKLGVVYGATRTFRTLLTTPVLTSPAHGVQQSCCSVSFQWASVSGATQYELNIARNASFTGSVYTQSNCTGTTTLQYNSLNVVTATTASYCVRTGTAINNGTWYWRVRAKNSTVLSNWSAVRSFNYVY